MCFRIKSDFSDVDVAKIKEFGVTKVATGFQARLDSFPMQKIPVIVPGSRVLDLYRWGLVPYWVKDIESVKGSTLANARAETLSEKPSFKQSFANKRCLILASGFYEFDASKQMHFYQVEGQKIFAFAGLYDEWEDNKNKETIKSCTIITCEPNSIVKKVHNRMPVILKPEDYERWLTGKDFDKLKKLLLPYDGNLIESKIVKKPKEQKTLF